VQPVELGHIGGRAVAFTADGRYALASVETVSEVAVIEVASQPAEAARSTVG